MLQYLFEHKDEEKTPSALAERRNDPDDRRRVLVRITEKGCVQAREQNAQGVDAVARELSALGERNAAELLSVLEKAYSITYDKDNYLHHDGDES